MRDSEVTGWMWAEACELIDQAERLHRQFFRVGSSSERVLAWEPPIDVYETSDRLSICVALPGVAAENIHVLIEGDVLSVAGVRLIPEQRRTTRIHRLEIPHGRFERRIRLPARSMEVAESRFDNGCLTLSLRPV